MKSASRGFAFLVLAGLALTAVGCGSNNKGKIVGKWKITEFGGDKDADKMKELGDKLTVYMEFREDSSGAFGIEANDPMLKQLLENSKDKTTFAYKYKLLNGDVVELYDLPKDMQGGGGGGPFGKKDRAKARVKIDGDNMTISDDETLKDKPLKLIKMK